MAQSADLDGKPAEMLDVLKKLGYVYVSKDSPVELSTDGMRMLCKRLGLVDPQRHTMPNQYETWKDYITHAGIIALRDAVNEQLNGEGGAK